MNTRQMVTQLVDAGYRFDRISPSHLIRKSMERESDYQIHNCPNCASVDVDVFENNGLYMGICLTCRYEGKPAGTAINAAQLWNKDKEKLW